MTAQAQLDEFLAKYSPEMASQGRSCLAKLRRLMPTAIRLVYDNYNALVIGFSATIRPSDAIVSMALFPRYTSIFFLKAAVQRLPDPEELLRGNGTTVRHVRLQSADDLESPALRTLLQHAIRFSPVPFSKARGKFVIQSISARQRPRRPKRAS